MSLAGIVNDTARFFRGGQGIHNLPEEAVTGILAARRGVAPSDDIIKAISDAGAIFDGGSSGVIKNAPKGENLLDALKGRVNEELFTLMNSWKDKNFPKRLEQALQKQEQLLPKMREALMTQQKALSSSNQAAAMLQTSITRLDGEAKAAVAAGNDELAARLLGQKLGLSQELTSISERATKYAGDVTNTKNQITTLESKIQTDREKSGVLLAEWKLKRELKDLSEHASGAMKDLNRLEADALANARQADQATKDANSAIDDLLSGGGVRVPGGGAAPTVPTTPVMDDAVKAELDRIKAELGKG